MHEIGWYLKGGPNLGPPLRHPLSMVQSVVINFSSKVYSKSLLKGSPMSCTSLKEVISCPEVWRPIFWKVKRIYILSRSMEAAILESEKDLYLVQKYGGRYV